MWSVALFKGVCGSHIVLDIRQIKKPKIEIALNQDILGACTTCFVENLRFYVCSDDANALLSRNLLQGVQAAKLSGYFQQCGSNLPRRKHSLIGQDIAMKLSLVGICVFVNPDEFSNDVWRGTALCSNYITGIGLSSSYPPDFDNLEDEDHVTEDDKRDDSISWTGNAIENF